MAEPFAASVLNSLLQPRVPLARVTRSTAAHSALAANFFTPRPRQPKHKASAADASPAVGHTHILECQAWAYPPGKQSLWGHDGPMRTTLMGEIEPEDTKVRVRRPSKSNRSRFHKPLTTPEKANGQRRYHVSYSSAAQLARDYSGSSVGNAVHAEATDEQPVASTSAPSPPSPLALFQEALESGTLASDFQQLAEQFSALEASGRFAELPSYELLELAEVLADQIDNLCIYLPDASVVRDWGQRLRSILDLVDESASQSNFPVDNELAKSILSRSAAFMGDFIEARESDERQDFPAPNKMNFAYLQLAYTSRVLSLSVHKGIAAAIDYFFLETPSKRKQFVVNATLEGNLLLLFTRHDMRLVIEAMAEWGSAARAEVFDSVLSALNGERNYTKSFDIILEIRRAGLECPSNILAKTCEGLVSINDTEKAKELFNLVPRKHPAYTALKPYVNLKRKPPDTMFSSAVDSAMGIASTLEKFNAMYPKDTHGIRTPRPTIRSCGALLQSLFNARDYHGCIELWEDMKLHNVPPDLVLATQVVKCHCNIEDTVGLMDTLQYLKKIDFKGDNVFYTTIIRFFTVRLDPTAATTVYEEAIANGVVPDQLVYRNLMRAYFRSGRWKDALTLFTKLRETAPEVMDIHTYNIVLQGAIFMGAPFRTLVKMFVTLERQGLDPNKYTYAILTRGALDAGQFAFVEDLYKELVLKKNWKEFVDISFFTDVMKGYVRMGKLLEAKNVLKKMDKLGLKPTAVTHAAIIKSYTEGGEEGGIEFAEEYLHKIVTDPANKSWKNIAPGTLRKDPLALMYGPLLDKHCSKDDVEAAERLIGEYLNNGGTPTLGLLKALLGLYGRLNRLDDFRSVWNHLLEIAMKPYRKRESDNDVFFTRMRPITAPLDIYTKTLSKACFHREVAQTWRELSMLEHEFDASNWHAFAHASLRAGQVENAFRIMEHSFQPRFNSSLRNHFRDSPNPNAPHEEKLDYYLRLYRVPPPRALIEPESRVRAAHVNKAVNRAKAALTDEHAMAIDFAFPLTLLQRIGPAWHDWKPRMGLLESLLMAMLYLEDGFPIRALQPEVVRPLDVAAEPTENRGETEVLLKYLHENHPRTMHRLRRFRYRETLQLGQYGFKRKYILSR